MITKRNIILIGVIVFAFAITIGIYSLSQSKNDIVSNDSTLQQEAMEKVQENVTDEEAAISTPVEEPVIETVPGKYIEYSGSSLTDKQNVIFFAASWCPTCRGLDQSINSELSLIPSDLTILKANYDSENELKRKYGVTYQHTLVQVDQEGNLLKKWNGSQDIEDIINQLI